MCQYNQYGDNMNDQNLHVEQRKILLEIISKEFPKAQCIGHNNSIPTAIKRDMLKPISEVLSDENSLAQKNLVLDITSCTNEDTDRALLVLDFDEHGEPSFGTSEKHEQFRQKFGINGNPYIKTPSGNGRQYLVIANLAKVKNLGKVNSLSSDIPGIEVLSSGAKDQLISLSGNTNPKKNSTPYKSNYTPDDVLAPLHSELLKEFISRAKFAKNQEKKFIESRLSTIDKENIAYGKDNNVCKQLIRDLNSDIKTAAFDQSQEFPIKQGQEFSLGIPTFNRINGREAFLYRYASTLFEFGASDNFIEKNFKDFNENSKFFENSLSQEEISRVIQSAQVKFESEKNQLATKNLTDPEFDESGNIIWRYDNPNLIHGLKLIRNVPIHQMVEDTNLLHIFTQRVFRAKQGYAVLKYTDGNLYKELVEKRIDYLRNPKNQSIKYWFPFTDIMNSFWDYGFKYEEFTRDQFNHFYPGINKRSEIIKAIPSLEKIDEITNESEFVYKDKTLYTKQQNPRFDLTESTDLTKNDEENYTFFLEFVQNQLCQNKKELELILDVLAILIQNPKNPTGVLLEFIGDHGAGKSLVLKIFSMLIGPENSEICERWDELVGDRSQKKPLVIGDDMTLFKMTSQEHDEVKTQVSHDTQSKRKMYENITKIQNPSTIIVTSNISESEILEGFHGKVEPEKLLVDRRIGIYKGEPDLIDDDLKEITTKILLWILGDKSSPMRGLRVIHCKLNTREIPTELDLKSNVKSELLKHVYSKRAQLLCVANMIANLGFVNTKLRFPFGIEDTKAQKESIRQHIQSNFPLNSIEYASMLKRWFINPKENIYEKPKDKIRFDNWLKSVAITRIFEKTAIRKKEKINSKFLKGGSNNVLILLSLKEFIKESHYKQEFKKLVDAFNLQKNVEFILSDESDSLAQRKEFLKQQYDEWLPGEDISLGNFDVRDLIDNENEEGDW